MAVPDLHCCADFSLVGVSGGYFLVVESGLLVPVASLVVEHREQISFLEGLRNKVGPQRVTEV